ncbi:ABC transporter ATP-binding protein [Nocardia alni]|uniref:ABC transporter ATP-binding protein n=1 Tax=Nocardia alni TaxID=2815723 RepID=UPI001C23BB01|nr:ABC transporter ATP-binding protein [Nocardia alni]
MTEELTIDIRNLRKDYGDYTAIHDVSMHVARGETVALLGTNGAGKTSTLDIVSGFARPTSGTVRVLGADPYTQRNRIAPRIGVMLQEAGFLQTLTPAQTLDAWRRFAPDPRGTDEMLELTDLVRQRNTVVSRLSGGERRRLDLALSLIGNPELLLLDEPTTGLDPEARRQSWQLLDQMAKDGMSILLTTHYMEEAEYLADRFVIIDGGYVVREGTVSDITARTLGTVSFKLPAGVFIDEFPLPDFAELRSSHDRINIKTARPQELLQLLLNWATSRNLELIELRVDEGTLEQAFLDIADKKGAIR